MTIGTDGALFAFVVPKPECEAVIVHEGVSWPITTEAKAYMLAKECHTFGFWRLKDRARTASSTREA